MAALAQQIAVILTNLLAVLAPRIRLFGLSIPVPGFLLRVHRELRRAAEAFSALAEALRQGALAAPAATTAARPRAVAGTAPAPDASTCDTHGAHRFFVPVPLRRAARRRPPCARPVIIRQAGPRTRVARLHRPALRFTVPRATPRPHGRARGHDLHRGHFSNRRDAETQNCA